MAEGIRADKSGELEIDERRLQEALDQSLAPELHASFAESIHEIARNGLLVTESGAVPWMAIEDFAYSLQGLPQSMRTELGVAGTNPDEAREHLSSNFPNAPYAIFREKGAALLVRDMTALLPRREPDESGYDPYEERPSRPRPLDER